MQNMTPQQQAQQQQRPEPEENVREFKYKTAENIEQLEKDALYYFLGLKSKYASDRQQYDLLWRQAMAVYDLNKDQIDKIYQGNSELTNPIMRIKVRSLVARMMRILFNVKPWGRIQDKRIRYKASNSIVELWNKYVFQSQIPEIQFESKFREFLNAFVLYGFAVAKIPQVTKYASVDRFGNGEYEDLPEYDNTDFVPLIPQEFYSDSACRIQDSAANIHHTTVSYQDLLNDRYRIEETTTQETDELGNVYEVTNRNLIGCYKNLELLQADNATITEELNDYLNLFLIQSSGNPQAPTPEINDAKQKNKDTMKTGMVEIHECWGKYWHPNQDGELEWCEVVMTIANGWLPIRFEKNDFGHRQYKRPFVACNMDPMPRQLYSKSNVILGLSLYSELNATRQQSCDARNVAIWPMFYEDRSKQVKWNKKWSPMGVISGNGSNGITPIINPYLGAVIQQDTNFIQQDMDMLFNISPVQQGTSDNRLIPNTARGTAAVIAQNDITLNDSINNVTDMVLKPFLEILFERNLRFKEVSDLLDVWDESDIQNALQEIGYQGDIEDLQMSDIFVEPSISLLGNMELSNEVAHQAGWQAFYNISMQNPTLAKRVKWPKMANKLLASYGIKDDSEDIFFTEEELAQAAQAEAQYNQQQQQLQQQQIQADQQSKMIPAQIKAQELLGRQQLDQQMHINDIRGHAIKEKVTTEEQIKRDAARISMEAQTSTGGGD